MAPTKPDTDGGCLEAISANLVMCYWAWFVDLLGCSAD